MQGACDQAEASALSPQAGRLDRHIAPAVAVECSIRLPDGHGADEGLVDGAGAGVTGGGAEAEVTARRELAGGDDGAAAAGPEWAQPQALIVTSARFPACCRPEGAGMQTYSC
jgi:hypothetical protein